MEEEEKQLLFEIDNLHSKLLEESNGQWNGVYLMKPNGYSYSSNANRMLEKIHELKSKFNPDYLDSFAVSNYAHTCIKEVKYVENHYKAASKKNAARIREREFLDSINKANQQIGMDLFSLFKKISDLKNG